jgi:hypothetical protein
MSVTLAEALQEVDLEPGQKYRLQVRGRWIELQVLDEATTQPRVEAEGPISAWVDFPEPEPLAVVQAELAPPEIVSSPRTAEG